MGMHKIEVARGIQWVEFPDVGLRILCGCPADAVKHLIKRGLILPKQFKGVVCETGPNAILLSDVSQQNGEFANLAEFPVLQMLYKQGLIVPGHPNNTGKKPLLIGSAEQVDSQMRYIYRGNYGLVSEAEMIETGVSPAQANDMMRIKLKFAFGHIRPTSDFLDTCVVGDDNVTITEGVSVRRLEPNVFEFSHGGETLTVDLNLRPGEIYECAYPLGYRRFEPEYFAVIHTGEGDGWDVNRPCMSSIITYQGRIYLIDAGPNIANSLNALGIGIDQVDGIFHTHAHDDHFAGLTTLMRAGRRIRYFTTPLVRASVTKKLAALMCVAEEEFAEFFDVRDLVADKWNDVEGMEVMPVFSPHPVETNIFVFRALWANGYRTYGHFADIVAMDILSGMVTEKPGAPGLDRAAFERVRASYQVKLDLKKVDVGGSMIHGNANDFKNDESACILLAHRASDLTAAEKEIGSSAAFGTVDVLVAGQSEPMRHHAFAYLATHLPGMPIHDIKLLLNHPMIEINPGALILKEGEIPDAVLLLVSGRVEKIRARDHVFGSQYAGSLIGIGPVLNSRPSHNTYRASSFVRAIRMPAGLYSEVIKRNGLMEHMRRTAMLRAFLDKSSLFNEGLPASALARIVESAVERQFAAGASIVGADRDALNIVRSGKIERMIGDKSLDILDEHDFFGEEGAIFKVPYFSRLEVREDAAVIQIPGDTLQHVPLLRWKLLDRYHHRIARVVYDGEHAGAFVWRHAFAVNVAEIDQRHAQIIGMANKILEADSNNAPRAIVTAHVDTLSEFAAEHFESEAELLHEHGYPLAHQHAKKHDEIALQLSVMRQRVHLGEPLGVASFRYFFEAWLVRHILHDDRKVGEFLNSRSVR